MVAGPPARCARRCRVLAEDVVLDDFVVGEAGGEMVISARRIIQGSSRRRSSCSRWQVCGKAVV